MICVDDILYNIADLKVIIILESPYKSEIIHNHPLAGRSGNDVSKYIKNLYSQNDMPIEITKPWGCELVSNRNVKMGIMNASRYPLDSNTYPCSISDNQQKVIEAFSFIKRNPTSRERRDDFVNRIERLLLDDFKIRIHQIVASNTTVMFVPCGELAEKFINFAEVESSQKLAMIPHPSHSGWNGLNNQTFNNLLLDLNINSNIE